MIEVVSDVPDLWEPARGAEFTALLKAWDREPTRRRDEIEDQLRQKLRTLTREDVPPLRLQA